MKSTTCKYVRYVDYMVPNTEKNYCKLQSLENELS